jgi:hypothetical protein
METMSLVNETNGLEKEEKVMSKQVLSSLLISVMLVGYSSVATGLALIVANQNVLFA